MTAVKELGLYICGKEGNAAECGHKSPVFRGCEIIGLNNQVPVNIRALDP